MLMLPPTVRVYVAVEPVDLRKGFDGLACVARHVIAVPLNRLSKMYAREGVHLAVSTLADWSLLSTRVWLPSPSGRRTLALKRGDPFRAERDPHSTSALNKTLTSTSAARLRDFGCAAQVGFAGTLRRTRRRPPGAAWLAIATGLLHCPVVLLLSWGAPAMKTSLDHLPELKRAQLRAITSIFCEGAPNGMLILFGSHARGDWVQDPETGYRSDFDLIFIVETEKQAEDLSLWSDLERRAREAAGETPVTLIVHDIKFVNHEIRIGQYFFGDIVNEGVLLHDSRRFQLAKPKALNPAERLSLAERNFINWFDSASEFWRGSRYYASRSLLKHAAFLLHQATERYYHAALLVFTGYKQRTHDIEVLGRLAGEQHAGLSANDALPKADPEDRRLFDLLKKAYVDARYSMSYRITMEELSVLQERVISLGERVRAACLEKMATFCGAEAVSPNLPVPPKLGEALLSNLPPPPTDPAGFAEWAQGLVEVAEQRVREGEAKGLREGEAKGSRERGAADILMVLTTRGIPVPAEVEQQIAGCSDPALLSLWLKRAVTAIRAEEVVAPAP